MSSDDGAAGSPEGAPAPSSESEAAPALSEKPESPVTVARRQWAEWQPAIEARIRDYAARQEQALAAVQKAGDGECVTAEDAAWAEHPTIWKSAYFNYVQQSFVLTIRIDDGAPVFVIAQPYPLAKLVFDRDIAPLVQEITGQRTEARLHNSAQERERKRQAAARGTP